MFEQARNRISEYGQKYEIDLAYAIKNEFWVYLRQGVLLTTGLAASVAFARLAPKEVYGQYGFLLAILAIASLLSIPGLNTAVLRSVARGCEGNYKTAVKTSFLWSLLGIPALLGVGAYYYFYSTRILGVCLMMSSIFFPFIYAPNTWNGFLQGKKRFDLAVRYGSIHSIVNAAALIMVVSIKPNHLVSIFITYLVTNSFLSCLFYLTSLKYIGNNAKDGECQRYGYFLTTTAVVGTLAQNIDKILIGLLLGTPQLATYTIALAIPNRIKDLLKFVWAPFTPKLSQDNIEMRDVQQKMERLVLPLILALSAGSVLYWVFIDDLMLLLFSSRYAESSTYSRMLLLMILFSIPNAFLGTFTMAKKKTVAIILGYHIFPFLKILIISGFVYQWGITGAVWALNLNTGVQALLIWAGMKGQGSSLR